MPESAAQAPVATGDWWDFLTGLVPGNILDRAAFDATLTVDPIRSLAETSEREPERV